ncbi:proteinase-activated receptor 1-like [Paramacrobiotus metropolitanus]|uniref:proteinase-activated receptor 1-like n=1 Tax=Paramacrobiotus metropolitanus TaxID=2943436 RepID=UPI00244650F2|nr:proteinase-activated receptor 1-like [Paramacrobiotus metropolitanus]
MSLISHLSNLSLNETEELQKSVFDTDFHMAIVFTFLTLLPNGFLLIFFMCHRHLITPFSVYVISLLTANVVSNNVCLLPYSIIAKITGLEYGTTAITLCLLFQYGDWVIMGVTMYCHVMITMNRLWAVYYPVYYRQRHNTKVAVAICSSTWIVIHLLTLPMMLKTVLVKMPLLHSCPYDEGRDSVYMDIVGLVIYAFPISFVAGAYPFIFWKTFQTQRRPSVASETITEGISRALSVSSGQSRIRTRSFMALTFMTVSVVCCYLPTNLPFIIRRFRDFEESVVLGIFKQYAYYVQAVVDPLVFGLCIRDIRQELVRFFVQTLSAVAQRMRLPLKSV